MATLTEVDEAQRILRQPGRLVLAPTATTGSFPFGGTTLGYLEDGCDLEVQKEILPVVCRNNAGPTPGDYIFLGIGEVILRTKARQWSDDVLEAARDLLDYYPDSTGWIQTQGRQNELHQVNIKSTCFTNMFPY